MTYRLLLVISLTFSSIVKAEQLTIGSVAPDFSLKNQNENEFTLHSRAGKGWTVLYFYPKAETPGCTKQACAFRDAIDKIRALNAEVYGISADTTDKLLSFYKNHKLTFDLLSDSSSEVIEKYGVKIPVIGIAKRWTFIIDPSLKIRAIEKDVDPMLDAAIVSKKISELQSGKNNS